MWWLDTVRKSAGEGRMAFHTALYDSYVFLGDPEAAPLWHWELWQVFAPVVDPLLGSTRGKVAIRSTQCRPGGKETVKFGRLGWKETDHQKWTHGSPTPPRNAEACLFLDVELWAPTWTQCEREGRAPDVFLSISNESELGRSDHLLFNPVVVFAVTSELADREQALIAPVLGALRTLTSAKLVVQSRRPWGKQVGSVGYTNAINDLHVTGLFKPGPRHKQGAVTLDLFADAWEIVP
jgi:hypothetical protein